MSYSIAFFGRQKARILKRLDKEALYNVANDTRIAQ